MPTGIVTFLFTDIEGSTRLLQELGDAYGELLATQRALLRGAIEAHGGQVFGSEGDALFAVFRDPAAALVAAADGQRRLQDEVWPEGRAVRVRIGVHTGDATLVGGDYVGLALHQTARIAAAGHGGQVLLSEATRVLASPLAGHLSARDLGEHRLKDLARAEHLYQLLAPGLDETFPPLRTLENRPNNLPIQVTTFVDREELAATRDLLMRHRLLTLTGPGGTGKTRLALQLAAEMIDAYPGGVFFVPLEAITDPELIASAVSEAMDLEASSAPPLDRLVEHLRRSRTLIVLDNFEQIVGGADVVGRLLHEAPELTLIVTSRRILRAYGEQEFPVPPLRLPAAGAATAEDAAETEAVRLFVERAMAVQPTFALTDANAGPVVEIVTRLDGLPLAIELAAARTRILPVEALRARLDDRLGVLTGGARDRPGRQQTLRAAIDWSHDLLDEPDRTLFRRFAVFAGGACLSQVEGVCGPSSELGRDVLDGVESLVEKSLVRLVPGSGAEPRFAMLATIREYAAERLAEAGDEGATLRRRHADAYLALVEGCAGELTGRSGKRWLDRLELDHDNLRAALDWAVESDAGEVGLRYLIASWRFWQIRGHLHEAEAQSRRILGVPNATVQPAALRSRALGAAGSIAYWRGAYGDTHRLYREALAEARRSGDPATVAEALYNAAFAPVPELTDDGTIEIGRDHVEEALSLYRELGDQVGVANTNWALGLDSMRQRDWEKARAFIEASLAAYRALDDPFGAGWALHELALIGVLSSELRAAESHAREALGIFAEAGDLSAAALLLRDFALIARELGDTHRAWRLAGAADAIRRTSGTDLVTIATLLDTWDPERPIDDPQALRAWDEGAALTAEAAVAYALGG